MRNNLVTGPGSKRSMAFVVAPILVSTKTVRGHRGEIRPNTVVHCPALHLDVYFVISGMLTLEISTYVSRLDM